MILVAFPGIIANAVMLTVGELNVIESVLCETLATASGVRINPMASLTEISPLPRPVADVLGLEDVVPVLLEPVFVPDWVLLLGVATCLRLGATASQSIGAISSNRSHHDNDHDHHRKNRIGDSRLPRSPEKTGPLL